MGELNHQLAAVLVHPVGELAEERNHRIVGDRDLVPGRGGAVDGDRGRAAEHGEADAALGLLGVIELVALLRLAVPPVAGGMARGHHPVADGEALEGERFSSASALAITGRLPKAMGKLGTRGFPAAAAAGPSAFDDEIARRLGAAQQSHAGIDLALADAAAWVMATVPEVSFDLQVPHSPWRRTRAGGFRPCGPRRAPCCPPGIRAPGASWRIPPEGPQGRCGLSVERLTRLRYRIFLRLRQGAEVEALLMVAGHVEACLCQHRPHRRHVGAGPQTKTSRSKKSGTVSRKVSSESRPFGPAQTSPGASVSQTAWRRKAGSSRAIVSNSPRNTMSAASGRSERRPRRGPRRDRGRCAPSPSSA